MVAALKGTPCAKAAPGDAPMRQDPRMRTAEILMNEDSWRVKRRHAHRSQCGARFCRVRYGGANTGPNRSPRDTRGRKMTATGKGNASMDSLERLRLAVRA